MATYVAEKIYIASIYPGQLEDQRRSYGPSLASTGPKAQRSMLFHLPPVPRGSKPPYVVIEVPDCFEEVLDVVAQGGTTGPHRPRMQKPVPVETIVNCLLASWTGGMFNVPPGAKPGVMQIVGTVPTQREMAQMQDQQGEYFEYWFAQGENLSRGDPSTVENYKTFTKEMRLAADWLGRDRTWSNSKVAVENGPCPFCTTIISNAAIVCPACQKQIREIPAHLAALNTVSAEVKLPQKVV